MPRRTPTSPGGRDYELGFGPSGSPSGSPYIDSSGMVPTSGVNPTPGSGTIGEAEPSGPWMIETQSLSFRYARVPHASIDGSVALSLSAADYTVFHQGTYLQAIVGGSYKKTKSYDIFDTSAFVQPQQFLVEAVSSDASGGTYGTLPSGTNVAFGPQGKVSTTQEWYYRRMWDDDIDIEITKSLPEYYSTWGVRRYNASDNGAYVSGEGGANTLSMLGGMKASWLAPIDPFSALKITDNFVWTASYLDYKSGGYAVSQEAISDIWTTINAVGWSLKTGSGLFGTNGVHQGSKITEYDPNRHDFT